MKRLTPAMLTVIMLLFLGGLAIAYIAKNLLARQETVQPERVINVPMSLTDLEPGTRVTDAHLVIGRTTNSKLEELGDDRRTVVLNKDIIIGRYVRNRIERGTPLKGTDFFAPGERPPLEITPGMQALTVSVGTSTNLVDGHIVPGQFVDVHFTPSSYPTMETTGGMTMTLFRGVKVLGINQQTIGTTSVGRGGNSVTLELSEPQANALILAKNKGELTLTYRADGEAGDGGFALSREDRATFEEILGITKPEEEEPEPPHVIEVYPGGGRFVQTFVDGKHPDHAGLINGRGYGNGYGNSRGNRDNGGWLLNRGSGSYGGGYGGGGYWSVPADNMNGLNGVNAPVPGAGVAQPGSAANGNAGFGNRFDSSPNGGFGNGGFGNGLFGQGNTEL